MIKTYFFDASAIAKLFLNESGSEKIKEIFDDHNNWICTSWVLLAEVLGILKRKWKKGQLSERKYRANVYHLFSIISEGRIKAVDVKSGSLKTFADELVRLEKIHSKLDTADLLQIAAIKGSFLKIFGGASKTQLVTEDETLWKAAKVEMIPTVLISKGQLK